MVVIGIDFGNESCVISSIVNGKLQILENDYFERKTPTFVAFDDNKRLIGTAAKNQLASNLENTIYGFKEYLGDPGAIAKHFEMKPIIRNGGFHYNVQYFRKLQYFSSIQVTAMLLAKLKADATAFLDDGNTVNGCVIAVPSFFTREERQSLLIAAGVAELDCFHLIKETSAIAINYGFYKKFPEQKIVAFVDFGMTSMQVFICKFEGKRFEMLAENYVKVGGRDIDKLLAVDFESKIGDWRFKSDEVLKIKLLSEVEKLKKKMSADADEILLNLNFLKEDTMTLKMGKNEMEEICSGIFGSIEIAMEDCLKLSGLDVRQINSIEIVGGSSRIPKVKEIIKKVFGKSPVSTMNQDEAVSRGCALKIYLSRNGIEFKDLKAEKINVEKDDPEVLQDFDGESRTLKSEQNHSEGWRNHFIRKMCFGDGKSEEKIHEMKRPRPQTPNKDLSVQKVHENFQGTEDELLNITEKDFKKLQEYEQIMTENDAKEDKRRDMRNKLHEIVIDILSLGILNIMNENDREIFTTELESCKTWPNGTFEEYKIKIEELMKKTEAILLEQKKLRKQKENHHDEKRSSLQREHDTKQTVTGTDIEINRVNESKPDNIESVPNKKHETERKQKNAVHLPKNQEIKQVGHNTAVGPIIIFIVCFLLMNYFCKMTYAESLKTSKPKDPATFQTPSNHSSRNLTEIPMETEESEHESFPQQKHDVKTPEREYEENDKNIWETQVDEIEYRTTVEKKKDAKIVVKHVVVFPDSKNDEPVHCANSQAEIKDNQVSANSTRYLEFLSSWKKKFRTFVVNLSDPSEQISIEKLADKFTTNFTVKDYCEISLEHREKIEEAANDIVRKQFSYGKTYKTYFEKLIDLTEYAKNMAEQKNVAKKVAKKYI